MSRHSLIHSLLFVVVTLCIGYVVWDIQEAPAAQSTTQLQQSLGTSNAGAIVEVRTPAESTNDTTPSVTGTLKDARGNPLIAAISIDSYAAGRDIQTFPVTSSPRGKFSVDVPHALVDGQYTVTVQYRGPDGKTIQAGRGFFVDTQAPTVTLNAASNQGIPTLTGTAPTSAQDTTEATVDIYVGTDTTVVPIWRQSVDITSQGTLTTGAIVDLPPGTYTAIAHQRDYAGNIGYSKPVPLMIIKPLNDSRLLPQQLTLKANYLFSDATTKYRFSGMLTLPAGVSRHNGCRGSVSVQAQYGHTVSRHRVKLRNDCTYRSTNPIKTRFAALTVSTQYRGTSVLKPRTAKPTFIQR